MSDKPWRGDLRSLAKDFRFPGEPREPPASPFPAELVERIEEALRDCDSRESYGSVARHVGSVVAKWLRSAEARARVHSVLLDLEDCAMTDSAVDAVLAAVLEGAK